MIKKYEDLIIAVLIVTMVLGWIIGVVAEVW